MAGVEQGRQEDDARPGQPADDVAHRRELGRAGEDEDAHRHRLERGEARRHARPARRRTRTRRPRRRCPAVPATAGAGRSPGQGPRAGTSSRDRSRCWPIAIGQFASRAVSAGRSCRRSRRRRRRRRACRARSRRRGGDRRSPSVGHFQTHQRSFASSGVVSAAILAASSGWRFDERRDGRGPLGFRLARVRVVLADVRRHGLPPRGDVGVPVAVVVSAARHRQRRV